MTNLTASAVQTLGSHTGWTVTGSWTKNPDAVTYTVYIADNVQGEKTDYDWTDVSGASQTASLTKTSQLAPGGQYWFVVKSKATGSDLAVSPFTVPALDTAAPEATYSVNRRAAVLIADWMTITTEVTRRAPVVITQKSTDEPIASRQIIPGDGSAAITWPTTKATASVIYTTAGVFTPQVRVEDKYGNVKQIALPSVTVTLDKVKPNIAITVPAKPTKVASWRIIRGTASDTGSGLSVTAAFVMQKRGSLWWAYDFRKKKWVKGYSTAKKTSNRSNATAAYVTVKANGTWSTPAIKGLKPGKTVVQAAAADMELNFAGAQFGPRTLR